MNEMKKGFPEKNELVVGTVTKAKGFGVFVKLEEYPGKEGFIHIKEVASGWVKNVRNHAKENQRLVCKVMEVDPSKGHVDLSLKRVNEHQKKEKIARWKNEQKAERLFEMVSKEIGKSTEECYEEFGNELIRKYESLYGAFEECAYDPSAFKEGKWLESFIKVAKENISIPLVKVKGYLKISSTAPNGVKLIKEALEKAEENHGGVEIHYAGAPLYRIDVTALDYKTAEEKLKEASEKAISFIKNKGGNGEFERDLKK